MENVLHTVAMAVASESVKHEGKWIIGLLHEEHSSSLAGIEIMPAVRYQIHHGTLPSAAAAFKSMVSPHGLFRNVPVDIVELFHRMGGGGETISPDDVRKFVCQHGVFSHDDCIPLKRRERGLPRSIQKWWQEQEKNKHIPFAVSVDDFSDHHSRVRDSLRFWRAIKEEDEEAAREIRLELGPLVVADFEKNSQFTDDQFILSSIICEGLMHARVSPVDSNGKISPGIITSTVRDAIYLRFMQKVWRGDVLVKCARPKCREVFTPSRSDGKYHDPKCKNLDARRLKELRLAAARSQ
jgi:hypothetical protein